MAQSQASTNPSDLQQILLDDPEFLRGIVEETLQQLLEGELAAHLGADHYERTERRKGYRNGGYPRTVKTRVGPIQLLVPRDRKGTFQPSLFGRYQRNEKALVLALMEMVIQGVSTRKVTEITETLCGSSFSRSMVSSLAAGLDGQLEAWRTRPLEGEWPYLFVDARYEKVRHDSRVVSMAAVTVVGVNGAGYRSILAVDVNHSENEADYAELFRRLYHRGLRGVQLVISDRHEGLRRAIDRFFQGACWQRCQVHFMRNLMIRLRRRDRSWVLGALRNVYDAPDRPQAEERLRELVDQLRPNYPELAEWLEAEGPETLAVFSFPEAHRRRIRTTNGQERLHQEIRRRTRVVRIFPHRASCLRLVSALCQEQDEEWMTGRRYLDMSLLSDNQEVAIAEAVRRAG
ncbi:hypothetical protein AMJ82_10990 [candidate division TA06 bacterium SM23_40]|jgi:putative transposase|uniref:Mutator family transposase n=1 Tax=candidate division TA06 bacterium SM23_40 TaxID=1703774 RepID=A0A0S8G348_UNCT6|nr:MAG: hypothetical protein AMJ82_10990 [candidate division TA06 bacterium SM23_40]